jgi:hypothetical protein
LTFCPLVAEINGPFNAAATGTDDSGGGRSYREEYSMKGTLAGVLAPHGLTAVMVAAMTIGTATFAGTGIASAQAQPPNCAAFMQLRNDAQQKAAAVRDATQHKAERKKVCELITRFSAAEESVVKFLVANKTWCGIPDTAIKGAKASHENTLKFQKMACSEAPAAQPKQPSLSDAIGQPSVDTGSNTHTGQGTLDSLSGNPLAH